MVHATIIESSLAKCVIARDTGHSQLPMSMTSAVRRRRAVFAPAASAVRGAAHTALSTTSSTGSAVCALFMVVLLRGGGGDGDRDVHAHTHSVKDLHLSSLQNIFAGACVCI